MKFVTSKIYVTVGDPYVFFRNHRQRRLTSDDLIRVHGREAFVLRVVRDEMVEIIFRDNAEIKTLAAWTPVEVPARG